MSLKEDIKGLKEKLKEIHIVCKQPANMQYHCKAHTQYHGPVLSLCVTGEWCHHFMYLVRSQEQVVASQVLAATSENLRHEGGAALLFPGSVKLSGLYSDFKVTLEVYVLQTSREVLPHDVKYHISGKKVCYIGGLFSGI